MQWSDMLSRSKLRSAVKYDVAMRDAMMRCDVRDAMKSGCEVCCEVHCCGMQCVTSGAAPEGMLRPNVGGGVMRR